jgi:hypothetical protein
VPCSRRERYRELNVLQLYTLGGAVILEVQRWPQSAIRFIRADLGKILGLKSPLPSPPPFNGGPGVKSPGICLKLQMLAGDLREF